MQYYLSVSFCKFYIWLSHVSSKKVQNNLILCLNCHMEENLLKHNEDSRAFMSRKYQSDTCSCSLKFEALKTSKFALEASFHRQTYIFFNIKCPLGDYQLIETQLFKQRHRKWFLHVFVKRWALYSAIKI